MMPKDTVSPDLLADIGGTNARFALLDAHRRLYANQTFSCADFKDFADAVHAFLTANENVRPKRAAIAVATPVIGDRICLTNSRWSFSRDALKQKLNLEDLIVVNDFSALAMALPVLIAEDRRQVGGGTPVHEAPMALMGPGTGLGVSGLIRSKESWIPLAAEGGHASVAPIDEKEWAICRMLQKQFGHVSLERLLSGPGLVNLYTSLSKLAGRAPETRSPAEITHQALTASCEHCTNALNLFCGILGSAAGNLALTLGARGGVYIGGGMVPRFVNFLTHSEFRSRFENKGRFSRYLSKIPTWVITATDPALRGLSTILH